MPCIQAFKEPERQLPAPSHTFLGGSRGERYREVSSLQWLRPPRWLGFANPKSKQQAMGGTEGGWAQGRLPEGERAGALDVPAAPRGWSPCALGSSRLGTPAEAAQRWGQGGCQSPGAFSDCARQEIPQLSRGSPCLSQLLSSQGAGTELCVSSAVPLSPLPDLLPGPGDRPLAQPQCLLWDVGQRQGHDSLFWHT